MWFAGCGYGDCPTSGSRFQRRHKFQGAGEQEVGTRYIQAQNGETADVRRELDISPPQQTAMCIDLPIVLALVLSSNI